jgi:hypothetical protein
LLKLLRIVEETRPKVENDEYIAFSAEWPDVWPTDTPKYANFGGRHSRLEFAVDPGSNMLRRVVLVMARNVITEAGGYHGDTAERGNPVFKVVEAVPDEFDVIVWSDALSATLLPHESAYIVRSGACQFEFDPACLLTRFVAWMTPRELQMARVALNIAPANTPGAAGSD